LLNEEAAGRHAVCFNTSIECLGKRGGSGKPLMTRGESKARPTQARRVTASLPPWSGSFKEGEDRVWVACNADHGFHRLFKYLMFA